MAFGKSNDIADSSKAITKKAATLVETAVDLADQTFETAVDKADMTAAETAYQLKQTSARTRDYAHRNARKLGAVAIGVGAIATIGAIAMGASKMRARRKSREDF